VREPPRSLGWALCGLLAVVMPQASLAEELVRYRTRDGRLGFADRLAAVPAGAIVLEVEARAEAKEPATLPPPVAPQAKPTVTRTRRPRASASSETDEQQQAERWRAERTRLDDARVTAEKQVVEDQLHVVQQCRTAPGRQLKDGPRSCAEAMERLEKAKVELERTIEEAGQLEDRCRMEGCLPGWIRD